MASLVNNTAHLIIVDGKMYIPRKPVDNVDIETLSKQYPEVEAMIKAGQLLVKTPKEAKEIAAEYEQMEIAELKAYAKANDIKLGRAKTREAILEAIKKAEADKWNKKG